MTFKNNGVLQGVLKYLAAISIAMTFGTIDPAPNLLRVPPEIVDEVIDDAEGPSWRSDDRRRLFHLLARDARASVRGRIAEAAGALWTSAPEDALGLLHRLANDPSSNVREASSRGLANLLEHASPLDRVQLTCEWATSSAANHRHAVAAALCNRVPCTVADVVLGELVSDRHRDVRRAALRAASIRFDENPAAYAQMAEDRLSDEDRQIRDTARRMMVRSSESVQDRQL